MTTRKLFTRRQVLVGSASLAAGGTVFSAARAEDQKTFKFDAPIRGMVFSPDGEWMAIDLDDERLVIQNLADMNRQVVGKSDLFFELKDYLPDGTRIVTRGKHVVRLWDAATATQIGDPMVHKKCKTVNVSGDGARLLTTAWKGRKARLWDVATTKQIGEITHDLRVRSARFSPDGKRVATTAKRTARLWDGFTGEPVGAAMKHPGQVHVDGFAPDGKRIVTRSERAAYLWDGATGEPVGEALRHEEWVDLAVFSPDGTRVATGSQDRTARLWDSATGKPLGEKMQHDKKVESIAYLADGSLIATTDESGLLLWDAVTGKQIRKTPHAEQDMKAIFSPNGSHVALIGLNSVIIRDTASYRLLKRYSQPRPSEAQFSRSGRAFAAVSEDERTIVLTFL